MTIYLIEDDFFIHTFFLKKILDIDWEYSSGLKLINIIEFKDFYRKLDLIPIVDSLFFIDIRLNSTINGIDLAKKIREKSESAKIIFITASDSYAIAIINQKIQPYAYIQKNANLDIFQKEIRQIIKNILFDNELEKKKLDRIRFDLIDRYEYIHFNEILYLEKIKFKKKRIHVVTKNKYFEAIGTLSDYKAQLYPGCYYKKLRTYIINLQSIQSLSLKNEYIEFEGGEKIYLSKVILNNIKKN